MMIKNHQNGVSWLECRSLTAGSELRNDGERENEIPGFPGKSQKQKLTTYEVRIETKASSIRIIS